MHKLVASVLLALSLTSCAALDVLEFFTPDKGGGIDTEIVFGDKKQDTTVNTNIGSTKQTAEVITNNVEDGNTFLITLLAIGFGIGIILPTPANMWKSWRDRNV